MATPTKRVQTARITDRREYIEELEKLSRVRSELEVQSKRLDRLKIARNSSEVSRYLSNANPVRRIPEEALDEIAVAVAAEGVIGQALANRLQALSDPVPMFRDEYDAAAVNEIEQVGRFVEVLRRAVAFQNRRVDEQKKLAIDEVLNGIRTERQKIARDVADSALALIRAVNKEAALFGQLRAQDEALPAMLRPKAFPAALHSNSPIYAWLAEVLEVSEPQLQELIGNSAWNELDRKARPQTN